MNSSVLLSVSLLSLFLVSSCGDSSGVKSELVYEVENSFEATSIRKSDLYEDLHQLDNCLVGAFSLNYNQPNHRLNFGGLIGNVCEETLVFKVPDKSDPNVFLSHNGRQYRWCGVSSEWNNAWSNLELKAGETYLFGSPLVEERGWEQGTQDFTVSIAWPKPGNRPEKFCDYGPESHYLRTYRPEISDENREIFLRVIEERMNE